MNILIDEKDLSVKVMGLGSKPNPQNLEIKDFITQD